MIYIARAMNNTELTPDHLLSSIVAITDLYLKLDRYKILLDQPCSNKDFLNTLVIHTEDEVNELICEIERCGVSFDYIAKLVAAKLDDESEGNLVF